MKTEPNQTPETNCRPASPLDAGGNSDAPFTLDLAFPAAVAQLCVRPKRTRHEHSGFHISP